MKAKTTGLSTAAHQAKRALEFTQKAKVTLRDKTGAHGIWGRKVTVWDALEKAEAELTRACTEMKAQGLWSVSVPRDLRND